ncbi:dihydrolipoyllysine-residue acetyltransferase [secondary endosymbiont of Ctenarytaina eucalypti]|uniref:Dihydrolipoamide acetyltransferase component of pyruvate dehydrogenase complex n=1 Tax=secondary endosymbiont of Ctenarytaina eucalypti TaxID=1199245 RepID=J3TFG3_9ENTR|nr:dihydrolipoyllysine-residue acetyltransferase [secondary endosymbiont of Ctenarytaina eucalypti]AFP84957.1 pyruvate/2-oxoglutarate dehydrogenase complex, dihydrolipoamide acyltransferase component [secondary endosymbiont of Ctenarytaina eucalypti]
MAIKINVPDIGPDEVEVIEVLVKVGDQIRAEQPLITVEGDKASMEVPSPQAGVVKELKVAVGDKVSSGKVIMIFEAEGDKSIPISAAATRQRQPHQSSRCQDVNLPDIGNDEMEITDIMVKVGDKINAEQSLLTVEGDKASMEVPAPFGGTIKEIRINVGDKIRTGSLIMVCEAESDPLPEGKTKTAENSSYVHATPLIRRLARAFCLNLENVKGTGRKGRILHEDLQPYIKDAVKQVEPSSSAEDVALLPDRLPCAVVDFSRFGAIEEVELSRIQKISGANLHRNWMMVPHVTQFDEADITDAAAFLKKQNSESEKKQNVKITLLVFIMKAIAKGLGEFPRFNSSLSADAKKLTLKQYINIGVAVDTPNGLVVPVIRDVNKQGILELSCHLSAISNKARAGKLTLSDMRGGCFTISNLGGISGTAFTPIVNSPEVAILGVSKSSLKPVWDGKEFMPRLMLPLSLSYDHRVIDGAAGARFMSFITYLMSDIRRLVI